MSDNGICDISTPYEKGGVVGRRVQRVTGYGGGPSKLPVLGFDRIGGGGGQGVGMDRSME